MEENCLKLTVKRTEAEEVLLLKQVRYLGVHLNNRLKYDNHGGKNNESSTIVKAYAKYRTSARMEMTFQ